MRIGLTVPQLGQLADPATIKTVAIGAEAAGYHSLWAIDRLMAPLQPRSAYPGTPDGAVPAEQHTVLDPLGVLGLAAAVTERVRLGTNVLVAPWYPPVLLARSLTTLDHVSAGRLTVGLGVGWSHDEYEAVGVPKRDIGARLDAALDALNTIWTHAVVQHDGPYARIAPSTIEPKPIQQPRPPLLLAAFTPAGLDRIARRADGWLPVGLPHDVLAALWNGVRISTVRHGRDPEALQLVVRANVHIADTPLGQDRPVFCGAIRQIADDLLATRDLGAHELILDLQADARTATELLELAHAITTAAEHHIEQPERAHRERIHDATAAA
jgi:probable F420-dependent oxidoreductase